MSTRVDANLVNELKPYGVGNWNACFHCGNCTANCPLTEKGILFPRKGIRSLQMGLKEKLAGSVEPWLCYYCGDCSEKCPRDANPGELMMTLRRYLTGVYDWTGLSNKMYRSKVIHIAVMSFLFIAVLVAFLIFAKVPELSDPRNVQINTFAPPHLITLLDEILLGVLSFFLLTNMINMFWKIVVKDKSVKIPIWLYVKEVFEAVWNFLTQWRFKKCERKIYWLAHWFMMSSYIVMFSMIVFALEWFQTEEIHPVTHPQRWLGYYVTIGLVFATVYAFIGRLKKKEPIFKFSHHSDWVFLFLLFMIAVTGILIHIFRLNGMAMPTYYMYALHLAFEVPMVVTFVAFSKWSHLAYRPLAIYLSNLKKTARARMAQA